MINYIKLLPMNFFQFVNFDPIDDDGNEEDDHVFTDETERLVSYFFI